MEDNKFSPYAYHRWMGRIVGVAFPAKSRMAVYVCLQIVRRASLPLAKALVVGLVLALGMEFERVIVISSIDSGWLEFLDGEEELLVATFFLFAFEDRQEGIDVFSRIIFWRLSIIAVYRSIMLLLRSSASCCWYF